MEPRFPRQRAGPPLGAPGRSLLLPRSAEMRREEEPRKADCPGCHGDFPPNTAKQGNFYAKSVIQIAENHQKEARLAFVLREYGCLSDVCCSRDTNKGNNLRNRPWVQPTAAELLGPAAHRYRTPVQPQTVHREPWSCCFSLVAPEKLDCLKKDGISSDLLLFFFSFNQLLSHIST